MLPATFHSSFVFMETYVAPAKKGVQMVIRLLFALAPSAISFAKIT
jgi:hypothetical protein